MKNTEIITLCGSTKFDEALRKLTLEGKIVFSIENIDRNKVNKEQKKKLEELHFKKIYLSDGIYVIDINEYIGEGTKREINYAIKNNKFVRYYSRERNT
ncbi:MAG: hypothetical protein Q7S27_01665 [Nanoarchaeota archaeon]|nr:hypothetical protein [Nanoarchaeota archaeon]